MRRWLMLVTYNTYMLFQNTLPSLLRTFINHLTPAYALEAASIQQVEFWPSDCDMRYFSTHALAL
jgi:hypothetical protein